MALKVSFWRIFAFLSFIGGWATESLTPDADGKVRITIDELQALAEGICAVFGWTAVIVLPSGAEAELPKPE